MSLKAMLDISESRMQTQEISEERMAAQLSNLRNLISFFREYPDLMVDYMCGPDGGPNHFKFYFYQRVFIRVVMRHRYVFATFPRAYSKSFLSMMVLMLRCILYPGANLFVTTGGKEQAASITISKIEEICRLIPALSNEINWDRGKSTKTKDNVKYLFKNGSSIDILAARESSRGQRRVGKIFFCSLLSRILKFYLELSEDNLNENYKNPWEFKLTKSQIFMILSVIDICGYSESACGKVFGVVKSTVNAIRKGKIHKEISQEYLELTEEQKQFYCNKMLEETDVIKVHYELMRGPVKNPLTQEQVNYILDNCKTMSGTKIAKTLGISSDRVSSVKKIKKLFGYDMGL